MMNKMFGGMERMAEVDEDTEETTIGDERPALSKPPYPVIFWGATARATHGRQDWRRSCMITGISERQMERGAGEPARTHGLRLPDAATQNQWTGAETLVVLRIGATRRN
jgi:hypothetical protein